MDYFLIYIHSYYSNLFVIINYISTHILKNVSYFIIPNTLIDKICLLKINWIVNNKYKYKILY